MDFAEQVLQQAPRLGRDDPFAFTCHPGIACFCGCCQDLTLALTPYDILRLRRALHCSTGEFIKRYTRVLFDPNLGLPIVLLQMNDDQHKTCPFVSQQGCQVYPDRPGACRLYPVGRAEMAALGDKPAEEFFFLIEEEPCMGYATANPTSHTLTISQWLSDQGLTEYDEMAKLYQSICFHPQLVALRDKQQRLGGPKLNQVYLALYDLDAFSTRIMGKKQNQLADDDCALLRFSVGWLNKRVFSEKSLTFSCSGSRKTPERNGQEEKL